MQSTVRILKIFLASPSDVKEERAAAESLVNDINKRIRSYGWQIELYRWEDALPSFGRPQEIINPRVDECAIFVGLLWQKWGKQTGDYTSGFEEEFERALARRKATGEPQIWLVFKAPSPERLKDPGPELSKVLDFRSKQTSTGELFYAEVADLAEWKSNLTQWLWDSVAGRLAAPEPLQPQQPASRQSIEAPPADVYTAQQEPSQQLLASVMSLTRAIKNTELEAVRKTDGALQEFDVARLFLACASMMSRWFTGETLQTHDMNLIYRHRQSLEPIAIEHFQLLRGVLVDVSDVIPGWFWFKGMTLDSLREQLLAFAEQDPSVDLKRQVLRLLREASIPLPSSLWASLPLWDNEDSVRADAYKYLATVADETVLPILEELSTTEDASISSSASEAKFLVLVRFRPEEAFMIAAETGTYASDAKLALLERRAGSISDGALLRGTESQSGQIRKFAARELARRGRLSKETAEQLKADPVPAIRQIGYTELANQGGGTTDFANIRKALTQKNPQLNSFAALLGGQAPDEGDADSVILTHYRKQPAHLVAASVEWFDVNGVLAYKSLAIDHFDAIQDVLRSDLQDGFERVKKESTDKAEQALGAEYAKKLLEGFKGLDDFIRSQFLEAALAGLAMNGEASDIRFGRQYMATDRTGAQVAAVRIVSRFGTAEDAPALLNVAKEGWGEARDEAGIAALRLSTTPFEIARELIQSISDKLKQAGYTWLYSQRSPEVDNFFEVMMDSVNEKERLSSVYYFSKTRSSDQLENTLEARLQKDKYYYNVITWLDRLIYAPDPLKEFFRRKLAEEACM